MRLVFVTQRIDPDDPVLGATVAKIEALARRFDEVVVLTDHAVPGVLPANCRVRTFAAGGKAGRGLRFERAILAELRRAPRPVAVLAHMCPIYAVLAAPLVRPLGVRVLLWYAQWHATATLKVAARLSNAVISVDEGSVPIASAKVAAIGHGIDVEGFACAPPYEGPLTLLALGRYSESKRLEPVVEAVARARGAGVGVRLVCRGPVVTDAERATLTRLEERVAALGLASSVDLGGPVPRGDVPVLLARSSALVNNTRSGAPDKVVYEACAACLPVLVSSPPLEPLVAGIEPQLLFPPDDAEALAAAIAALSALDAPARGAIGAELRDRVAASHSTASWADAVVRIATR